MSLLADQRKNVWTKNTWVIDRHTQKDAQSSIKSFISRFVNKTINFKHTTVKICGKTKSCAHNNTGAELKRSGANAAFEARYHSLKLV